MTGRFPAAAGVRFSLVLLWAICFSALIYRELVAPELRRTGAVAVDPAGEKNYYSIYQGDKRIGRVVSSLTPDKDAILLSQDATLLFQLLGQTQPLALSLTAKLAADMTLQNFQVRLDSPFYHMRANGVVEQGFLRYTLDTGKTTIADAVRLDQPPRLSTGRRPWLLHPIPEKGRQLKAPFVDPFTLTTRIATLTYHGREKILVRGQVLELHHFSENFSGVRINSWLDDDGSVVQEHSPAGFVLVAEKNDGGNALEQGQDLLQSVAIPFHGKKQDIFAGATARFRIELSDAHRFELSGGRQAFHDGILTVTRENTAGKTACAQPASALAPEPFIQSKNPAIHALAAKITAGATDDSDRIRLLSRWLYKNIKKQPVIGLPDAVTTLETKTGDCNEHAALFAAMARSLRVPARIAAGVALFEKTFYYHAWNEVCLADRWISVDTTLDQFPADLGHLRFVAGGLQEMTGIISLLHRLKIREVKK